MFYALLINTRLEIGGFLIGKYFYGGTNILDSYSCGIKFQKWRISNLKHVKQIKPSKRTID